MVQKITSEPLIVVWVANKEIFVTNNEREVDTSVVQQIIAGDTEKYAEIINRYEAKLTRYVVYLIHNSTIAQDVVQETFIKAYQNLRGFNPKYKFSSWIYRIAHNEAMNAVKKNRRLIDKALDDLPEISYNPDFEQIVDTSLLKGRIQECLSELEPKYREVIQLIFFENMKYDEVSDILHIPTSTAGVWLLRAKKKLKIICQQKGIR